jgi:hypothetical protein
MPHEPHILKHIRRAIAAAESPFSPESHQQIQTQLDSRAAPLEKLKAIWQHIKEQEQKTRGHVEDRSAELYELYGDDSSRHDRKIAELHTLHELQESILTMGLIPPFQKTLSQGFKAYIDTHEADYVKKLIYRNFRKNKEAVFNLGNQHKWHSVTRINFFHLLRLGGSKVMGPAEQAPSGQSVTESYIKTKAFSRLINVLKSMPDLVNKFITVFSHLTPALQQQAHEAYATKTIPTELLNRFISEVRSSDAVWGAITDIAGPIEQAILGIQNEALRHASRDTRDALGRQNLLLKPTLTPSRPTCHSRPRFTTQAHPLAVASPTAHALQTRINELQSEIKHAGPFTLTSRKKIKRDILKQLYTAVNNGEQLTQNLIDKACKLTPKSGGNALSYKEVFYKGTFSGWTRKDKTFKSRTEKLLNRLVRQNAPPAPAAPDSPASLRSRASSMTV